MAGNTKLMGFTPDGKIHLERWGGKVEVPLSPEDLDAVRHACYAELPKRPEQSYADHDDRFAVGYNERTGLLVAHLGAPEAEILVNVIALTEFADPELAGRMKIWKDNLLEAIQAHKNFHNTENEPGVES